LTDQLHAVVTGAGVGGLSAAIALAKAGLKVTVLERAEAFEEVGAGLQLAPNATGALRELGILDGVLRHGLTPEQVRIRRARDGKDLARAPLGPIADLRWGAPYLVIHRADLQRVLLDRCAAEPSISVLTGVTVAGFAVANGGVEIGARKGNDQIRINCDFLIAADGVRSVLRERIGLGLSDQPVWSGRTAWRALVPAGDAPEFARKLETGLWLGPKAHLVHYPLRGGEIINVVAITEDHWRAEEAPDFWAISGDPAAVSSRFSRWHSEARSLVDSVTEWRRWPIFDRSPAARWSIQKVALLGDAAHPMVPFLSQGAAQAIEDAAALGAAFCAMPANVDVALANYQSARVTRAAAVVLASRRQGSIYHMSGPMALARDMVMTRLGRHRMLAKLDWLYDFKPRA
jgi:salicylate hydroxylase